MYEHPYREGGGREINERVEELAAEKDVSMAQIALAWLLHKDWVDTPIVGTTSVEHLEAAVEALDISLSDSDLDYLEDPYEPVRVSGHE
jgi:aryl-alcohol dehydrogenase-like predicted oxidoreductase